MLSSVWLRNGTEREAEAFLVVAVDRAKVREVTRHERLRGPGALRILRHVLVFVGRHEQECCDVL
jgi:hypothetical protein